MKKQLFICVLLVCSVVVQAQSKSYRIYDTFNGREGVSNFSFSKNMIDVIDIDLGDNDEKRVTGDLTQIRFMSYNPKKGSISGNEFTKKAVALLSSQYKKYIDDDEDTDAEIWLLGKKKKFTECHVFTTSEDENKLRFLVSFYGNFNVNDINKLKQTGKDISESE